MMTLKELAAVTKAVSDVVRQHVAEAFAPLDGRIKALEDRPLPEAIKGEDGKSVTVEEVAPLIEDAVAKAVAAIPAPKDGQDADSEAILAKMVDEAHTWLAANPPQDGKSVTVDDVAPLIAEQVAKAVAALPAAKDGEAGRDADMEVLRAHAATEARQAAVEWAKANPPKNGEDGKTFTLDEVRALVREAVEAEQAKWALDFERRAQGVLERSVERLPKPKDGEDGKDGLGFDDLQMDYDGERTFTFSYTQGDKDKSFSFAMPVLIDRGVFKEADEYARGDVVTWGGSLWIAQKDAPEGKPGLSDDWRLSVKRGRDAK